MTLPASLTCVPLTLGDQKAMISALAVLEKFRQRSNLSVKLDTEYMSRTFQLHVQ